MKSKILLFILLTTTTLATYANCDLTRYRGECNINMHIKPTKYAHSLVYCGNTYGYITTAQYDTLARYQRANVNMSLTLNGDRIDGPCVPSGR